MSDSPNSSTRLQSLCDAVCDEVVTEQELREIEALAQNDERARQRYSDACGRCLGRSPTWMVTGTSSSAAVARVPDFRQGNCPSSIILPNPWPRRIPLL